MLSLTEVGLRSVKGEAREAAHLKFLIFFISFSRSLLEVSVLPFLEFNIPFECYDASSETTRIRVIETLHLVPWILLFNRFNSPLAFRVEF